MKTQGSRKWRIKYELYKSTMATANREKPKKAVVVAVAAYLSAQE